MPNLVTAILTIRVLGADPEGGSAYYTRTIDVPEVPRVGDNVFLGPTEREFRKVIARDWGYDGTPQVRLSTINTAEDAMSGSYGPEALVRDGWELDPVQDKG